MQRAFLQHIVHQGIQLLKREHRLDVQLGCEQLFQLVQLADRLLFLILAHDVRKHQLVGLPVRDVVYAAERIRHRVHRRAARVAERDACKVGRAQEVQRMLLPAVPAAGRNRILPAAQDHLQCLFLFFINREGIADVLFCVQIS